MSPQMSSNVVKEFIDVSTYNKQDIAEIVKRERLKRKLTQKELAELSGITIRAVQRIENAVVMPRKYTLDALFEHIDLPLEFVKKQELSFGEKEVVVKPSRISKLILTFGSPVLLVIGCYAYILQSPTFPENAFELCVLIFCMTFIYFILLLKIWK